MKLLRFLSVCIIFNAFTQEVESIHIEKKNQDFIVASIEGVSKGQIQVEKLGSINGLQVGKPLEVISFRVEYPCGSGFKSIPLTSNRIPDSVVVDIRKSCLNEEVFFTEIKVQTPEKQVFFIDPISLVPILKDDE